MNEQLRPRSLAPATQAAEGLPRRRWSVAEIEAMVAKGIIARGRTVRADRRGGRADVAQGEPARAGEEGPPAALVSPDRRQSNRSHHGDHALCRRRRVPRTRFPLLVPRDAPRQRNCQFGSSHRRGRGFKSCLRSGPEGRHLCPSRPSRALGDRRQVSRHDHPPRPRLGRLLQAAGGRIRPNCSSHCLHPTSQSASAISALADAYRPVAYFPIAFAFHSSQGRITICCWMRSAFSPSSFSR